MAEDVLISDSYSTKPKKSKKTGKIKQTKDIDEIPMTLTSDATQKTKARFDQLLKQAADTSLDTSTKTTKKKKKKTPENDDVLEKLKKGEGLRKDDDAAILANTYVPGNSPKNEKSNQKKQKERNVEGTDNLAYEDETKLSMPGSKRIKKKKNGDSTMSISELAPPVSSTPPEKKVRTKKKTPMPDDVPADATITSPVTSPRNNKPVKKKRKPVEEIDKTLEVETESALNSSAASPIASPREQKTGKKKTIKPVSGAEDTAENAAITSAVTSPVVSPRETKTEKKKKKTIPVEEEERGEIAEDGEETEMPTVGKKTKKRSPRTEEQPEEEGSVASPRSVVSGATGDEAEADEATEDTTRVKKRKKKKKKQEQVVDTDDQELIPDIEDEGRILAVTVHRTDKLKNDFYILHPLIRVHVVNSKTGQYLRKQHRDRPVTHYYEQENDNVNTVLPIMTQPFDFKERRSTIPMWEELLLFNENYNYFIHDDPSVILFFELLDFVSMNTASRQYSQAKTEGGWHRIAWAFLKVVGGNGKVNTGAKVRLQLFRPPDRFTAKLGQVELYQWWQSVLRQSYPSTLYVTLKGIVPPSTVEPSMRSLYATQEEIGKMTYQDLKKSMNLGGTGRRENVQKKYLTTWNRLAGQVCKIPNSLLISLHAGKKGCFVLNFSHDGRSLACACHDKDGYPIFIYEIPSGELLGKFSGHFGIVYDLCWSKTDHYLMSASSDGTVRVWDSQQYGEACQKLLPHPSFVYTAQFHPRVDTVIATGGYDQVIRVWDIQSDGHQAQLLQEIESHKGNINSLCFDEDGSKLYTADSVGSLKIWNVFVSEQPSRRGFVRDWNIFQEIDEPELRGVPINFLKMHPSGRRLLVHCRDNILRMVDLRVLRVMQKYIGALNFREEIHSTLTPCGTFIFSGSEDSSAYVWNTETGDQVACYSELNYHHPVTGVDYHPRDHMIAFCSLGENQAIFIYHYDPHVAAIDAGFPVKPVDTGTSKGGTLGKTGTLLRTGDLGATAVPTQDDFEASETARLQRVMQKLASVSLSSKPMIPAENHPLGMPLSARTMQTGIMGRSWGYESSSQDPLPNAFSPHAPRTLQSTMQQQQFASQNQYYKEGEGSWRPGFSSVGRHGARPSSPTFLGRPPTMSLNASQGKAQFSFQAPIGKVPKRKKVVALYDYKSQRSDELTLLRGDIIRVLYKDNENWWMGELPDGQQGFFPANYVVEEEMMTDDQGDDTTSRDGSVHNEEEVHTDKHKVTAIESKSGELKFVSATDDSEDDQNTPKKRPRQRRRKAAEESSQKRGNMMQGQKLRAHFDEESTA